MKDSAALVNRDTRVAAWWWIVSIIFLFCGAVIGLGLRFYFVKPMPVRFQYWLHAHSHVMLLGWVFNALFLLVYQQFFRVFSRIEKICIGLLQVGVLGMLISFPFQGYGPVSIVFSALHLTVADVLAMLLWIRTKSPAFFVVGSEHTRRFLRMGAFFQLLSSLGPFMLAHLMAGSNHASGIEHTALYQLSIFFYLHFLYNGLFFYLVLALWLPSAIITRSSQYLMALGTVLIFAHAILYVDERWLWSWVAAIGSILQLSVWLTWMHQNFDVLRRKAGLILLAAVTVKLILQVGGSFPPLSHLVVTQRFWLMAYLHFLFLGIYTPFIWTMKGLSRRFLPYGLYWLMLLGTEGLLLSPYLFRKTTFSAEAWYACIFAVYAGLVVLLLGITYRLSPYRRHE